MYTLGQKITIGFKLVRRSMYVQDGDSPYKYEMKIWEEVQLKSPIDGIVVGIRKLSNGRNHYNGETGNDYEPKEHFKAIIVAYHLQRKPLLVKIP